jgi:hypothetical protein
MHEILNRKTKGLWLEDADAIQESLTKQPLTKSELKSVFENTIQGYDNGKLGACLNWLLIAFLSNQEKTLSFIKKQGLLRCSKELNRTKFKNFILTSLLKYSSQYRLDKITESYLRERSNLSKVSDEVYQINLQLIREIRAASKHFVKDLLIILDKCFYAADKPGVKFRSDSIYGLSPEDLGDAVAYLIFRYTQANGIPENELLSRISNNQISSNYDEFIDKAAKIKKFEKSEVLIDSFGYKCDFSRSQAVISSPDNFLEKAIRYGFIHSDIQRANQALTLYKKHESEAASLSLVSDKFYEIKDKLINLVEKPVPRLVLSLPDIPELFKKLTEESLFLEEVIEISGNENEHLISKDQLIRFKVTVCNGQVFSERI